MDPLTVSRHLASVLGVLSPWGYGNDYNSTPSPTAMNDSFDPTMSPTSFDGGIEDDPFSPSNSRYMDTNATSSFDGPYHRDFEKSSSMQNDGNTRYDIPWWYTVALIMLFFGIVCFGFVLRLICFKFFGWQDPYQRRRDRHSQHPLANNNEQSVLQQITEAQGEIREAKILQQRQERRLWYLYFLKPYTTVLSEVNFPEEHPDNKVSNDEELAEMEEGKSPVLGEEKNNELDDEDEIKLQHTSVRSGVSIRQDSETEPDGGPSDDADDIMETGMQDVDLNDNHDECPASKDPTIDDSVKMMTIYDPFDTTYRQVEASCTICYLDYEIGDEIVRSAADEADEHCIHIFHKECIIQWLSQGKKRCPICRHWFVPHARIKDQMKEANVTLRGSRHHLYNADTNEDVISLGSGNVLGYDDDTDSSTGADDSHHDNHPSSNEDYTTVFYNDSDTDNENTLDPARYRGEPLDHVHHLHRNHHHHHRRHSHTEANNHGDSDGTNRLRRHSESNAMANNTSGNDNNNRRGSFQLGQTTFDLGIDLEMGFPGVALRTAHS